MPITGHGTGEGNFRGQRKNSVLPCKNARNSEYSDHYIPKVLGFIQLSLNVLNQEYKS